MTGTKREPRPARRIQEPTVRRDPGPVALWMAVAAGLIGALVWAYWPVFLRWFKDWQLDQNYSVGQLVPLAALYLLWLERPALRRCRIAPSGWGLALIAAGQMARLYGLLFLFESAERYSAIVTAVGVVLLVAGRDVAWRLRWIWAFLLLMVPLPGRLHNTISGPLQDLATQGAVFLLELSGVAVGREGNVVVLNGTVPIAVAEACSGLRMLTAFVVVASFTAYVVNRPRWQKAVLVISSVPVAIVCNLIRLVVTAELFLHVNSKVAEEFFHDFAGVSMMPLAVLMLLGELILLAKLVVPDRDPAADGAPGQANG